MYSGDDSTGSSQYAQWPLNPTAYQNVSNDQVDWAALAQQWILMKEAGPPIPNPPKVTPEVPPAPPVPVITTKPTENINNKNQWDSQTPPPTGDANNWNPSWKGPNWNNWNNWQGSTPPNLSVRPPLLPNPKKFNDFSTPPPIEGQEGSNGKNRYLGANADPSGGYWTSAGHQQQFRPHNKRFSKVNVPRMPPQVLHGNAPSVRPPALPVPPEITPPLDMNKRKQLPAWIREGLEKMEREKQKMIEKERETHQLEKINEEIDQSKKEKMELLKSTMEEQEKSKFESDAEISDDDQVVEKEPSVKLNREMPPKTREDMLLKVRRMMTQILLLVTDSQIKSIAKEEVVYVNKRKKYKASAQSVSAPRGANLSAKLGLSSYGSDSGSSSDSNDSSDERDSDEDLKEIIKRKQHDFQRKEQLIEDKISEAEKLKTVSRSRSTTPAIVNDNQVVSRTGERVPSSTPPRSKKEPRRSKSRSPSSEPSDYSPKNRKSSSLSHDSYSDRRRSRSYTPERKRDKSRRSRSKERKKSKRHERSRSRDKSYSRQRSFGDRSTRSSKRSRSSSRDRYSVSSRDKRSRSRSKGRRSKRSRSRDRRKRSPERRRRDRSRSNSYSSSKRRYSGDSSRRSHRGRRSRSFSNDDGKRSSRY